MNYPPGFGPGGYYEGGGVAPGRPHPSCPPGGILGNVYQRENGARINVTPQAAQTVRATVLQITAENDPAPYSIIASLYRRNLGAVQATALPFLIRARVNWGAGKQQNTVLLDYHHGTRVTFDASSIRVDVEYVSTGDEADELGPQVECGVSLVYGNIGTQATLTEVPFSLDAAGTSPFIPIPDFAREVYYQASDDPTTPRIVTFGTVSGDPRVEVSALPNTGIIIPNGVEGLNIVNSGATPAIFWLVWKLFI